MRHYPAHVRLHNFNRPAGGALRDHRAKGCDRYGPLRVWLWHTWRHPVFDLSDVESEVDDEVSLLCLHLVRADPRVLLLRG